MKNFLPIIAAGATFCLAGCFSVDTATIGKTGEEHVFMRTYGWKLFGCIPLVSGNANADGVGKTAFFRDDVTIEKVQERFAKYANGREIECPTYKNYDSNIINVYFIPIPYVLCYKEISISGTLK